MRRCAKLSSSTRRGGLAEGSGPLVAYLEDELGAGFEVTAPEMPNPDAPEAEAWEGAVDALLADLL